MILFDNHNHSQFSFDGKKTTVEASARSALSKGLGGIAFTDHCDYYIPTFKSAYESVVPEQFDIKAQQEEIDRVRAVMCSSEGFKILKGIEIGMSEENHEQIRGTLNANSFDQIIASVHYIEQSDPFYGGFYDGKDWKQAYGRYLEKIYSEMTWLKDFDIMGHYDYIARYAPYEQTSITYRDFSDIFDTMFRYLIEEGKALELNTKGYVPYKGRTIEPDLDVLKRYREMGGEIISLGSDSHDACRTGDRFTEAAAMLKSLGFRWTAHYEKRKLVQVSI
jgi:histidinol-phosphatase (PHP family)